MKPHIHVSLPDILVYGISAIVVINVVRLAADYLVRRGGTAQTVGSTVGALVHYA